MYAWLLALVVYAPPSGGAQAYVARVQAALKQLAPGGDVVVAQGVTRARQGWMAAAALDDFARAEALLTTARHAAERVELESASRAYSEVERIYEQDRALPLVEIPWSQAAVEHGVVLFELGHSPEAQAAFRRAHALDPELMLTERTVRPDAVRAFRDALASSGRATLTVTVEPPAEQVWVDGQALSTGSAAEVDVGEHWVVAARGRARVAQLLDVSPSPAPLALMLPDDPLEAELRSLDAQPSGQAVRALSELTNSEGAVAVALGVDAGQLTLVGARVDRRGCAGLPVTVRAGNVATLTDGDIERAAHVLFERTAKEAPLSCATSPILEAGPIAHPRPLAAPPRRRPLYAQPWFWATAAAVAATAVVLGVTLAPTDTSYRATVSGSTFSR